MNSQEFPAFVRNLPECEIPMAGLRGWLLLGSAGQLLFAESDVELSVPEHSHCDSWGVVIEGKLELTTGNQTRVYSRGDTYTAPAGVPHKIHIYPGLRAMEFFADPIPRYKTRPTSK